MDVDMIEDEVLADAYAGMNRFADADATEFTDAARETVRERDIDGNGQNEAATMETTGPPKGKRYSASEESKKSKKITIGMTDSERADILKGKTIKEVRYEGQADEQIDREGGLSSWRVPLVKTALSRIAEIYPASETHNEDMDISVLYAKGVYKESGAKMLTDPKQIARLAPILNESLQNAVHIESHANKYFYDNNTVRFDNLIGGYTDGDSFVPIRFGIKQSVNGENHLYVVIDDAAIKKAEVLTIAIGEENPGRQEARSTTYSVAKILQNVNSPDVLKYVPDAFLDERRKETKYKAIADTIKRTNNKNDEKYKAFIAKGNLRAAGRMVQQARQRVAELTGKPYRQFYSVSEDENGRAVAVVDDDILSHIDTANWDDTKKAQAKSADGTGRLLYFDKKEVRKSLGGRRKSCLMPYEHRTSIPI